MNIIDLGKYKQPKKPNTGFYMVAHCPKCTAPLFWHGPGEFNGRELDEMIYPSCLCDWSDAGEVELAAPDEYVFEIERHAINILFRNVYRLIQELEDAKQNRVPEQEDHGHPAGVRTEDS